MSQKTYKTESSLFNAMVKLISAGLSTVASVAAYNDAMTNLKLTTFNSCEPSDSTQRFAVFQAVSERLDRAGLAYLDEHNPTVAKAYRRLVAGELGIKSASTGSQAQDAQDARSNLQSWLEGLEVPSESVEAILEDVDSRCKKLSKRANLTRLGYSKVFQGIVNEGIQYSGGRPKDETTEPAEPVEPAEEANA